jgi:hypothetical protein
VLLLSACTTTRPVDSATPTPVEDSSPPTDTDTPEDTDPETIPGDTSEDTGEIVDPPLGDPTLVCSAALTCPTGIVDRWKQPCDFTLVSGDGTSVFDGTAMIELRGRSSVAFPKPPYSLELHEDATFLIAPGAVWRYSDGSTVASGWHQPGFDDSAWASGPAPLGYGDDQATWIASGTEANRPPAAWFRTTFEAGVAPIELELGIVRDDAAIVWLNGVEVARSNLAPGADSDDLALTTISDEFEWRWTNYTLDPALLNEGTNTLAVEVHQAALDSSDLRFDLSLLASAGRPAPNLFGMGGEDDWFLQSAYIDRLLWRNKLAYDLFRSLGGDRWASEQVYCELTLDGEYRGVYLLGESVRRDDDRLAITEDLGNGESFILKLDDEGGFRASAVSYGEWQSVYPGQDASLASSLAGIDAEMTAWELDVLGYSEAQWDHLDIDSAVDWVLLEELFKNNDAYFLSVYLWRDAGGPMQLIPWDFDLTLGYPYYDCGAEGWVGRSQFVEAWSASPAFQARLVPRWRQLRGSAWTDEALLARIAGYEATLGPAIERNFERWPVDQIAFSWGGVDNWLCPSTSWDDEHARVLAWIPARTAWLDAHITEF